MATTVHSDRAAPPAAVAQPGALEGTAHKMGLPSGRRPDRMGWQPQEEKSLFSMTSS
jgi:hypothetical protein